MLLGNPPIAAYAFLQELFECEFCYECHGDIEHHDAIPFLGNWFARCKQGNNCQLTECEPEAHEFES